MKGAAHSRKNRDTFSLELALHLQQKLKKHIEKLRGTIGQKITMRAAAEKILIDGLTDKPIGLDPGQHIINFATDPEGNTAYLSPRWYQLTGRKMEEAMEAVHPNDRERMLSEYEAAFKARRWFAYDYLLQTVTGDYIRMRCHGTPAFSPKGEFLGYVGSAIEIRVSKAPAVKASSAR